MTEPPYIVEMENNELHFLIFYIIYFYITLIFFLEEYHTTTNTYWNPHKYKMFQWTSNVCSSLQPPDIISFHP